MPNTTTSVPLDNSTPPERNRPADPVNQEDTLAYFDPSAIPLLSSDLAPLVREVFRLMLSEAKQDNIAVMKLTAYGHVSPEEGTEQLVLTQFVDLPVAEALTYRRRLFQAFGAWAETLPSPRRALLLTNLVINVRWNSHAPVHQP